MSLEAIRFDRNQLTLEVLDQLKLPYESIYVPVTSAKDGFDVIYRMVVRGAPAIAIVGALAVAVDVASAGIVNHCELAQYALDQLNFIVSARPTAVNLSRAVTEMKAVVDSAQQSGRDCAIPLLDAAQQMMIDDLNDNRAIGGHGADWVQRQFPGAKVQAMTICNTGSLATSGYGTALGVVRALHERTLLDMVYPLETRPYNQGARLTSYELVHDKIPGTLICDSMAASLIRSQRDNGLYFAVVGADRIALNGDTANKIGTYQLAVLAKYHGLKFAVAAPTTSIDFEMQTGDEIVIEERASDELTHIQGIPIAAPGISVWNPAFDVTPAELIDVIITEKGAVEKVNGAFNLSVLRL